MGELILAHWYRGQTRPDQILAQIGKTRPCTEAGGREAEMPRSLPTGAVDNIHGIPLHGRSWAWRTSPGIHPRSWKFLIDLSLKMGSLSKIPARAGRNQPIFPKAVLDQACGLGPGTFWENFKICERFP